MSTHIVDCIENANCTLCEGRARCLVGEMDPPPAAGIDREAWRRAIDDLVDISQGFDMAEHSYGPESDELKWIEVQQAIARRAPDDLVEPFLSAEGEG